MRAGEPEQGAETGTQALVIGAETNSARIINGPARLNRTLSVGILFRVWSNSATL